MRRWMLVVALGLLALPACSSAEPDTKVEGFQLKSPAFKEGEPIPDRFAYGFENVSPPLRWSGAPAGTVELAITVVDPDASNFVHWAVVGIDPTLTSIDEGMLPAGAIEVQNQFGQAGWAGPQPPAGEPHSYLFTLHALSSSPNVTAKTAGPDAVSRIDELTTATADLRGTYTSR